MTTNEKINNKIIIADEPISALDVSIRAQVLNLMNKFKEEQFVAYSLLTNAIKYTEEGEIDFTCKCINHGSLCNLMISVRDTGRGIKKDKIEEPTYKPRPLYKHFED